MKQAIDTHMERIALTTIHQLTDNYGFDRARAREAVEAIGDKGDLELAIGWLLDHGEEDRGGAITLKRCPHLDYVDGSELVTPKALNFGRPCKAGCPSGENWVCLTCGDTFCSRYVNKHCLAHWQATKKVANGVLTVAEAASGMEALGHHVSLSLSDLSVWCYECSAYVEHDRLLPHIEAMRRAKFGGACASNSSAAVGGPSTDVSVSVGDPLACETRAMHGTNGDATWAAPKVTAVCAAAARPGYRTCAAHEYHDEAAVLDAKVALLATMLKSATHAVAYTGAGISTAAGVKDYASKAGTVRTPGVVHPLEAQPTLAHHVLTALHEHGLLAGGWINQNHDGLPQKAGYPQHAINEIHGAWFDPSSPVVPMDGDLRADLISALLETEQKADLCLVAGTSLCGMNADRVVASTARRARAGAAFGAVLINLQRTAMDDQCQLRFFATVDEVMGKLAQALGVPVKHGQLPSLPETGDVFEVAYSAEGRRLEPTANGAPPAARLRLDLRPGAAVRLIDQPDWDKERCGDVGTIVGRTSDGHYQIRMPCGGGRANRLLGSWWVRAALEATVPSIPLVPANTDPECD